VYILSICTYSYINVQNTTLFLIKKWLLIYLSFLPQLVIMIMSVYFLILSVMEYIQLKKLDNRAN